VLVVSVSKPRWDSEEHPRRGTLANAQLDVELFLGAGWNPPSTLAVLCPSSGAGPRTSGPDTAANCAVYTACTWGANQPVRMRCAWQPELMAWFVLVVRRRWAVLRHVF
jgi:hypothetical protein